jgi:hypothetical protein
MLLWNKVVPVKEMLVYAAPKIREKSFSTMA